MDLIITFLSAAGLGGIIGGAVTSLLQAWLSKRATLGERRFREKKEAYIGYLNAIHRSEVEGTSEAAKNVGHWQILCDLVASAPVRSHIARTFATNPLNDGNPHPERPKAMADLKTAMRADLGIEIG
jgi:hypothetical protein